MDDPAYLALRAGDEDPGDEDLWGDLEDGPPPEVDEDELAAVADELLADQARAAAVMGRLGVTGALAAGAAAAWGRRGPGMPGSAQTFPGVYASRSSGFASGKPLDTAPAGRVLGSLLEEAAGDDDRYPGASDDELAGVIAAWDRMRAYDSARMHAAIAELARRRPDPGCPPVGPGQIPEGVDEFLPREVASILAETSAAAGDMVSLGCELEVNLPGTKAAYRDGILSQRKAAIIASATMLLDPDEARAAEAKVLDRAGALTPPALRAAIARAVMEVNPDKARKRREHAAKRARVERWAEDSGNASLSGRELPPAEVLAADQRVTAWALELRKAGLDGGMDALRARAYLDLLLGTDSRPAPAPADGHTADEPGDSGQSGPGETPAPQTPGGPADGMIPPGFAGHVTLTVPEAIVTRHADRPGHLAGIGPIDPHLARDLAAAAARNPRSTWCLTVTDSLGHAVGHGCARPVTRRKRDGHDPPDPGPGFTLTPAGQPGIWRLTTGPREWLIEIVPLPAGECDHRWQARGHDPGVLLRHLAEVRHATCTGPGCRRPASRCDFEHNTPYETGGRTCLCNANPKCRHDHRLKQDPRWNAEQLPDGSIRWTTPSGRQYIIEPTRYPI
ncbi:MAG TPA: DUF222 domain-containing protein [Streptosporangiaceae bacterium]|nr:DUF222 domain-containing protein [Streptosporangiaceae bacterium]